MKSIAAISTVLMIAFGIIAQNTEQKFSVYGFMDLNATKQFLEDNSLLKASGMDEDFKLFLNNVNMYFDFKPRPELRSLVELSFNHKPTYLSSAQGRILNLDLTILGQGVNRDTLQQGHPVEPNRNRGLTNISEYGSFSMERAWFEYQSNQYLNFRFGKFITPAGIWNVDHGSPVILTIRQPYQTGLIEFFPKSQTGIMERGAAFLGNTDLEYNMYITSGREYLQFKEITDLAGGARAAFSFPALDEMKLGISGYTGIQRSFINNQIIDITLDAATAGQMQLEAATEVMTENPGISMNSLQFQQLVGQKIMQKIGTWTASEAENPNHHSYKDVDEYESREIDAGVDYKISIKGLTLQTELNYQKLQNKLINKDTDYIGFYGLLSYGLRPSKKLKVTPYLFFERITGANANNNRHSYLGSYVDSNGKQDIDGFQVFLGGLNLNIVSNFTIKLEYSYADILTNGALKQFDDNININSINAQFSFAF